MKASQKAAMRALPPGHDRSNPIVLGAPNDADPIQVRVLVGVEGLTVATQRWVTGASVQAYLDADQLRDTTLVAQMGRTWKVGAFTYTSYADAVAAGTALGVTPIEVS